MRIGLIGAGRIGRVHARAVSAMNEGEGRLCLVADLDASAATELAASVNARACSPVDLITDGDVDAVIVATPPGSHEALCVPLLKRGVAVLCEKPLGLAGGAAHRMQKASMESDSLLCVSSKFVFAEAVLATEALIRRGELIVSKLSLDFSLDMDLAGSWQIDPSTSGGGVLRDRGPQALDIVRRLLGEPQQLHAPRLRNSRYAVEDAVDLRVDLADGRHADCCLSWRRTSDSDVYARVTGDGVIVELGWREARIWRPDSGWMTFAPGYDQHQAFTDQCRAFLRAARGARDFDAPLSGAIANQILIDRLHETWLAEAVV